MNLVVAANAALAGVIFLGLALPGLALKGKRVWVLAVLPVALVDSFITLLPGIFHQAHFINAHWNWSGKVFSVGVMLNLGRARRLMCRGCSALPIHCIRKSR